MYVWSVQKPLVPELIHCNLTLAFKNTVWEIRKTPKVGWSLRTADTIPWPAGHGIGPQIKEPLRILETFFNAHNSRLYSIHIYLLGSRTGRFDSYKRMKPEVDAGIEVVNAMLERLQHIKLTHKLHHSCLRVTACCTLVILQPDPFSIGSYSLG